jgi:hypothetical protein
MHSERYHNEQLSPQLGRYKHLVLLAETHFHSKPQEGRPPVETISFSL